MSNAGSKVVGAGAVVIGAMIFIWGAKRVMGK